MPAVPNGVLRIKKQDGVIRATNICQNNWNIDNADSVPVETELLLMLLKDEEGRFSPPCVHRQKIIIIIKVFVMQNKTVRMCSRMFNKSQHVK